MVINEFLVSAGVRACIHLKISTTTTTIRENIRGIYITPIKILYIIVFTKKRLFKNQQPLKVFLILCLNTESSFCLLDQKLDTARCSASSF